MDWMFSTILVSLGQTAAILVYLCGGDKDAFRESRSRGVFLVSFFVLQCALQTVERYFAANFDIGSLPTLIFLAAGWLLYTLLLYFWSRARWPKCCFVAFVLLLVDSCIWPLISSGTRMLWGVNYLYEGPLLLRLPFILLLSVLECLLAALIRRLLPRIDKLQLSVYDGILAMAIIMPFLYFRHQSGMALSQNDKSAQIMITACCLVAVLMLAAEVGRSSGEYEKLREAEMLAILRQQQAMFEQKLKDADLINRKYHDMKNALLYLRANGSEAADSAVEELIESIAPYENDISTGNEVVDVILNEKLGICAEEGITCIPYLDGKMLAFVRPLDLCTLIGNAMDNAIESCRRIPERTGRHISVHTAERAGTVVLQIRNTFETAPDLRGGLPATSKADRKNHGYGLRNMQYIAEQYGGQIGCRVEEEEFVLNVILSDKKQTGGVV